MFSSPSMHVSSITDYGVKAERMRMMYFLLFFFLVYGSLHGYAFLKIARAFSLRRWKIFLVLFMVLMVAAPVLVRLAERAGFELFARFMSYLGYTWMGVLFLFVWTALVLDAIRCLIAVFRRVSGKAVGFNISARAAFVLPFISSIVILMYGYFEARDIQTEKVTITTSKLPSSVERFRIVQISDVHLGLLVRHERLGRILSAVKEAEPDILICTGDLVDGQINNLTGLAEMFQSVKPLFGKFAVTGNHEFYAGLDQALALTREAGFKVLRGESYAIEDILIVVGVDDRTGRQMGQAKKVSERELLRGLSQEKFILLLKHRPLIDQDSLGYFDLQLSGHTHKGQIFPFGLITRLYYPIDTSILTHHDGSWLYVSRGSGTWGPPIRFLAPPEVTVIDLVREEVEVKGAIESG